MDITDCLDFEFTEICGNCFYFREKGDGALLSDNFRKSTSSPTRCSILSIDNKCLLLAEDKLRACNQPLELSCKFYIQMYNDSSLNQRDGRAMILYCNKENTKMVVCCTEDNEICPSPMDPPSNIHGSQHKAVFFLKEMSKTNVFTFESSIHPGHFLAFNSDEKDPSLKKLVLCQKKDDEVDERITIFIKNDKGNDLKL